ncbi:MAG: hypothetical protein LBN08_05730 [Lactobacillales bacterium]|nr:hypothetical protein [Lactobacillales bacterium]
MILRKDEEYLLDLIGRETITLTGFLNARQRFIIKELAAREPDLECAEFSLEGQILENTRILLYPTYYQMTPEFDDFKVALMEIVYPSKFAEINHRSITGAILNSGIKPEILGDIFTDGERWQVLIAAEMAEYLKNSLNHVGKVKISLKKIPFSDKINPIYTYKSDVITVSSVRLDNVIANAYKLSRSLAKEMVLGSLAKVNHAVMTNPNFAVSEGDVLSVRGYGRIKVGKVAGATKRDNIRLNIEKTKTK